jgi:hypothetical protein
MDGNNVKKETVLSDGYTHTSRQYIKNRIPGLNSACFSNGIVVWIDDGSDGKTSSVVSLEESLDPVAFAGASPPHRSTTVNWCDDSNVSMSCQCVCVCVCVCVCACQQQKYYCVGTTISRKNRLGRTKNHANTAYNKRESYGMVRDWTRLNRTHKSEALENIMDGRLRAVVV